MTYVCNNCRNHTDFRAQQEVTEYIQECVYIDGEGDIMDYGDRDCGDSEVTDGPTDLECSECDSTDVDWVDDIEDYLSELDENNGDANRARINNKKINNWRTELGGL